MSERDAAYRRVFHHPQMLRDLLACVLEADWLRDLDWAGLREVNTQYVAEHLQRRVGDGAWKIPRRSGRALYVLLMLEHQSRPDAYMALRMATYAGLLYQSLLRQKQVRRLLPPILPVVLYSGRRPWRAQRDLAGLIEPSVPDLSSYQLQLRYVLIDEGALLRAGGLPDANLAGLLFRLEHSTAIEQIPEILHTLMDAVQGAGFEELNRSLAAYIQHLVLSRAQPQEAVPQVTSLQELVMLISEKPGMWARQWKREGILEGRKEGQAALLERLLTRKFGPLPDTLVQRIHAGSTSELETWALNFIDADSIEQVFGS